MDKSGAKQKKNCLFFFISYNPFNKWEQAAYMKPCHAVKIMLLAFPAWAASLPSVILDQQFRDTKTV